MTWIFYYQFLFVFFFRLYAMQLFRNGLLSLLRPALILRNYTLAAGE